MEYLINLVIRAFDMYEGLRKVDAKTELSTKLDVSLFVGNVIVSLLGTVIVGLIVYAVITRNRVKRQNANKEMTRLTLLDDLEQKIREIHSKKSVIYPELDDNVSDSGYFEFRSAFDNEKWDPSLWQKDGYEKSIFKNGRRMWLLREDGARAGSDVLHESLLWFRNLERAYQSSVIDDQDLYILWRQILPFLLDNRYSYLLEYFGEEDVKPLRKIAKKTIEYCSRNDLSRPLTYIKPRIDRRLEGLLSPAY